MTAPRLRAPGSVTGRVLAELVYRFGNHPGWFQPEPKRVARALRVDESDTSAALYQLTRDGWLARGERGGERMTSFLYRWTQQGRDNMETIFESNRTRMVLSAMDGAERDAVRAIRDGAIIASDEMLRRLERRGLVRWIESGPGQSVPVFTALGGAVADHLTGLKDAPSHAVQTAGIAV